MHKNALCLWEVRSKKCAFSGRPRHQQRSTGTSRRMQRYLPDVLGLRYMSIWVVWELELHSLGTSLSPMFPHYSWPYPGGEIPMFRSSWDPVTSISSWVNSGLLFRSTFGVPQAFHALTPPVLGVQQGYGARKSLRDLKGATNLTTIYYNISSITHHRQSYSYIMTYYDYILSVTYQ